MKTRFILTPIAAATMALSSSFATATSHDAKPPIAETQSSVPQVTGQQQQQTGTPDSRVMDQQRLQHGTTAPHGGTTGRTTGAATTASPSASGASSGTIGTTRQSSTDSTTRSTAQSGAHIGAHMGADWERQHRASKIIGMDVVNRQGEKIGDIQDIVVDQQGNVSHAVVSTGGFLGIGERLHAIPWSSLDRGAGQNLVVDVDRDRLRNAPGFDRSNWPNLTDQQWRQENQRYFPQAAAGASARDTTGMQRAADPQTGSKPYGTDVDRDRMRSQGTGTQSGTTPEQPAREPASSNTTGNPVTNQPGTAGGVGNPPATGGGTGTR